MVGDSLIMELTQEQGPGRETQVQPPIDVWLRFFEIDLERPPTLRCTNRRRSFPQAEARPVVEHDHNWTVEILGAALPRPAIIRFHRSGRNRYDYWVYRPADSAYEHCRWLLTNFANPHQKRGRRWFIV